MNNSISLLDYISVAVFGGILSASFSKALSTRRQRLIVAGGIILILAFQGLAYLVKPYSFVRAIYPLLTHVPLLIILGCLTKKWFWSTMSILIAYLCCQLRHWLVLLAAALLGGGLLLQSALGVVITGPLLAVLLHYVSPAVVTFSVRPKRMQLFFGILPSVYYIFDYIAAVYTDLLTSGSALAVEFMPFVSCIAYLVFVLHSYQGESRQNRMEQIQNSLNIQIAQSIREISSLRESQIQARTYRHDLRHHLQYLAVCIENGEYVQAQTYIHTICSEIEAQKVQVYCENEACNLILSAFVARASKCGIELSVKAVLPTKLHISDSDLCVVLSNALENAVTACKALETEADQKRIEVNAYEKNGKLFLQVMNPCDPTIPFEDGIPVTDRPGHGIGVRSICAIVQQYNGMYYFGVKDGSFIVRVSL